MTSRLVPDAHLASLAIEHGLTCCSTDGDFARFPGLKWENPLAAGARCTEDTEGTEATLNHRGTEHRRSNGEESLVSPGETAILGQESKGEIERADAAGGGRR